jgi:hypothetical protein
MWATVFPKHKKKVFFSSNEIGIDIFERSSSSSRAKTFVSRF